MSGGGAAGISGDQSHFQEAGQGVVGGKTRPSSDICSLNHTSSQRCASPPTTGLRTQGVPSLHICHTGLECFWGKDGVGTHPSRSSPLHPDVNSEGLKTNIHPRLSWQSRQEERSSEWGLCVVRTPTHRPPANANQRRSAAPVNQHLPRDTLNGLPAEQVRGKSGIREHAYRFVRLSKKAWSSVTERREKNSHPKT